MDLKKELVSYVIFGILTTLVNIILYYIFADLLFFNYLISNIVAWIGSVVFAYVTNRIWVFESKNNNILKEISLFFGGRLFTGIIDSALMILFIEFLLINDFTSKIVIQIIVVILNYVLSKLVIFKQ